MPQAFCLEWYDDDPDLGMREDGFSLHLSLEDAVLYARDHASHEHVADPSGAYLVEISEALFAEVQASTGGVRKTLPREPNFRRA